MKYIILISILLISSCSNQSLENYKSENPKLNLRTFFNGKLFAQGIVQDRSGKVIQRFDVDINASWKDNQGIIDEKFSYSDNTKSERVWKLTEKTPFKYEGTAHDVIGVANGEVSGNAFLFEYRLNVPVGDTTYSINFEDWMYLLDQKTLLAKASMTKWGFRVGEVTLVMTKKDN